MNRMSFRGGPGAGGDLSGGPLQRARIALSNNQPAVTEEICRRRLEKKPDEVTTRLLLSQALLQLQRPKEAVTEAERVLVSQPNLVDALLVLSSALMHTNQANPPKESVAYAERAVQLQPRAGKTHVQLAEVLMMRKDFNRASEEADEAVRLEPRLAAAYLIKGLALLNLKDYEGSVQATQAALRQDKTMAPAYFTMAQSLAELKRTDEALEAVNKAQQLNPMLPEAQITQLRATIYRKQGRWRDAYKEFLTATNARSAKPSRFAPLFAAIGLFMSIFGQNGPYVFAAVLVALVMLVLLGISKIPAVGGGLVDILAVGIIGFLGWNAIKVQSGGTSPLALLTNLRSAGLTLIAFVGSLVVIFVLARLLGSLTTAAHHPVAWFNSASFGLALGIGLIAAFTTLFTTSTSMKR